MNNLRILGSNFCKIFLSSREHLKCLRLYSVYPPTYVKPTYRKSEQEALAQLEDFQKLAHVPIRPAPTYETCSDLHDPLVGYFIRMIMRKGKKVLARDLLYNTFEHIKRIQIQKYHKAPPEEKESVELNPVQILYKAFENSKPVLQLVPCKKGGTVYQIPVPISDKRSKFFGAKWLITAAKERDNRCILFPKQFAWELLDAASNTGKVIRKKQELYRLCEANRAYAHFRW